MDKEKTLKKINELYLKKDKTEEELVELKKLLIKAKVHTLDEHTLHNLALILHVIGKRKQIEIQDIDSIIDILLNKTCDNSDCINFLDILIDDMTEVCFCQNCVEKYINNKNTITTNNHEPTMVDKIDTTGMPKELRELLESLEKKNLNVEVIKISNNKKNSDNSIGDADNYLKKRKKQNK
jgi:hypothetical protein